MFKPFEIAGIYEKAVIQKNHRKLKKQGD